MNNISVRLTEMELTNFKNVDYGKINFSSNTDIDCFNTSDIIGIYGQNGSGKTAAINALELLRKTLLGQKLAVNDNFYISIDKPWCNCKYTFIIKHDKISYKVTYDFTLSKYQKDDKTSSFCYSSEKILFKQLHSESILQPLLNYTESTTNIFGPAKQYSEFVNKKNKDELLYQKRAAKENRNSFFFSNAFRNLVKNQESEKPVSFVLRVLWTYAFSKLFIISNTHAGLISLNLFPLTFSLEESGHKSFGEILMDEQTKMPVETYSVAKKVLLGMNELIGTIIPNLKLDIKEVGITLNEKNQKLMQFELLSTHDNESIPLKYESEGIRKIVSILNLLVCMYNNDDITVAVDELDAGIFEYLLGELISILKEHGKGQLIFTSHNLRPLEVLDYTSVYFTTVNSKNKYIRFKNVKGCNNLRDMFIRAINLGGQSECLYQQTDKADIRRAFRKTGAEK